MLGALQAFEARDLLGFNLGPVVVKPALSMDAGYNDNLFLLPDDSPLPDLGIVQSRDDVTFSVVPSISARLGRPDGDNQITFNYRFAQTFYVENTDRDSGDHNFSLDAGTRGSRLSYATRNSMAILNSIMTGYESTVGGVFLPAGNPERYSYSTSHNLSYDLSTRSRTYVQALFSFQDYAGDGLQDLRFLDYQNWNVGGGYDYAVRPELRLGGVIRYGNQAQFSNSDLRPDPPDTDVFDASLTASGSITRRLSGNVSLGYQTRDVYGDSLITSLALQYAIASSTAVSLTYSRNGELGSAAVGGSISDSAGLQLTQTLNARRPWQLGLGVRYVHQEYTETSGLSQENLDVTASVSRALTAWSSAFLSYTYEVGTRFGSGDYDANRVNLGVRIGL